MSIETNGLVLGIDLGASSLGVALIDPVNARIVHTGVRIFEAGVNSLDTAKETPKNADRRAARQVRRQTERRQKRYKALFRILQDSGLLPAGKRLEALEALDKTLSTQYAEHTKLPYLLRFRALDEALTPHALGRALYHLGQRRGFLSNRKTDKKAEEEKERSRMLASIRTLGQTIEETGCRTLGEYIYRFVDPHQERIRQRFTDRAMYKKEFEAIWNAQAGFHPELLSEALRAALERTIFYQRPLKPQTDKVGYCDLEEGERRAPMALLEVQRFRMLTTVNNLRLVEKTGERRKLTPQEREIILAEAESGERLEIKKLKKQLGLKDASFSLEIGGEKSIPANATAAQMRKAMGPAWGKLTSERQTELVEYLVTSPADDETLARSLMKDFGFDERVAKALSEVKLPAGYFSISRKAVLKLMPLMESEEMLSFTEAKESEDGYGKPTPTEPLPLLRAAETGIRSLRNPAVMRALSELRKTVNALIREYGKPEAIHIELARDLRRSHEDRMQLQDAARKREAQRDAAAKDLASYYNCSPEDVKKRHGSAIEKYLLWEECNHKCPYSGEPISKTALFGETPQFQVEHIIPLSRSLDNSFNNKTLCSNAMNARKGNRTPWEAFHDDDFERMRKAVAEFKNPAKLSRFVLKEADRDALLEEFTTRQLNDTRYASKLAAQYLGTLYGGVWDEGRRQRIFTCAGQITAHLRRAWRLDSILNPVDWTKSRDDHRHHAVDAVAIALSSPAIVKRLSEAAERAGSERRLQIRDFDPPWSGFKEDVRQAILATQVSLRPAYKLLAQMHDETLYSKPWDGSDGKRYVTVRKPLDGGKFEIEDIVDPRIREIVRAKIEAAGTRKKLNDDPPLDAAGRPIRRVRVKIGVATDPTVVGEGPRARNVMPNSIHHSVILRDETQKGKACYRHESVSTIEAMRRHRLGLPIVNKEHGEHVAFVCTLRPGDVLEAVKAAGEPRQLWRVRSLNATGQFTLHLLCDARKKADIQAAKSVWKPVVNTAFLNGARKVTVTHLGAVVAAND